MHRRLSRGVAALAVAAAAFAVYSGSLRNGFVWDDHIYVEGNPFVADAANYKKLLSRDFWMNADAGVADSARPVFVLSLLADRALWGANPRGYHLTNVALHAADSVLVYALSLAVLPGPQAVAAALLFAVHPANSEAVELPSFRPDLLAAFFVLLALLLHLRWRRAVSPRAAAAGALGCAALFGLGLLSKEMAVTFPALALALEQAAWPDHQRYRRPRRLAAALILYGAVAGGYLLWRAPRAGYAALVTPKQASAATAPASAAKPAPSAPKPAEKTAAPERTFQTFQPSKPQWDAIYAQRKTKALTVCGILGQELGVLALGWPLRVDRAPVVIDSLLSPRVWGLLLLLALALAAAARAWKAGERPPALALAWILLAWLPVSNVIAIYNPIAERYLYLLTVGAAWALAWAVFALAKSLPKTAERWAGGVLVAALALPMSLRTSLRTKDWRNDETLFAREAAKGADNARIFYNLGLQAQKSKDDGTAEKYYRKALTINPRYVEAQTNLAAVLCGQGKVDECVALLRQAAAENPTGFLPYVALGQALTEQKQTAQALEWYREAYEVSKHVDDDVALLYGRGCLDAGQDLEGGLSAVRGALDRHPLKKETEELFALLCDRLGRHDVAASHAAAAAGGKEAWPPDAASYLALGDLLEREGRVYDAVVDYRAGSAAAPKSIPLRLALARATTDLSPDESVSTYEGILRLDPKNQKANAELGALYMKEQRCDLAAPRLEAAGDLDPKDGLSMMNLGVCYHHLGRIYEAEVALKEALARDGSEALSYYNLGIVYAADTGHNEEAARNLKRATEIDDGYADAWYNLGVVMLQLGRKDEALRDFEKTITLAGKKIEAFNNAAALLVEAGQPQKAERLLRQALAVSPENTSLHNNLGEALLGERRLPEASAEFGLAIKRTPVTARNKDDLARYLRNLALCYEGMGWRAQAAGALRQAQAVMDIQ